MLKTDREKFIASYLITLTPCSARIAVIMGTVAIFLSPLWALAIFAITVLIIIISGLFLNKFIKKDDFGFIMEVFPIRTPSLKIIARKTWARFKDFIFQAAPFVVIGSIILGYLYETGYIWHLSKLLVIPIEKYLGLPEIAGVTLIFAILRKEMALQLLLTLAAIKYSHMISNLTEIMTLRQIFVYALVNTIYIPCISTISVLNIEIGWKKTLLISILTILTAFIMGIIANKTLYLLGIN